MRLVNLDWLCLNSHWRNDFMAAQPSALSVLGTLGPSLVEREEEERGRIRRNSLEIPRAFEQSIVFDIFAPHDISISGEEVLTAIKKNTVIPGMVFITYAGTTPYAPTYTGAVPYSPGTQMSSEVISEIDQLKAGVEDEEIPTDFAYKAACTVVELAYSQPETQNRIPRIMPKPWVTTDDVGGIRVVWTFESKRLVANFGARPDLQTYLYYESQLEHDAEPLNANSLRRRLAWLTQR
jgi:hypothetical protein